MTERKVTATRQASIRLSKETVHLDFYVHTTRDSQQHWEVSALLPPDARDGAIVVGGGGAALGHGARGAFLTSSCPTRDLDGWVVASKDHADVVDAHQLELYFLAVRIDGMRRPDLIRLVQLFEAHSAAEEHPTAQVVVPASHVVLSGGFWVDWHEPGNLATASIPYGNGWMAKSKSHIKPSPATIHAYAIGIKKNLPGAVSVEQHIDQATSSPATAHPAMAKSLDPAYLLTGAGAQVNWSGLGNMLTLVGPFVADQTGSKPVMQKVEAQAKDHIESDPSTITVYAVGARLPDTTKFNIDGTFNADRLASYVQGLTRVGV